MSGEELYINGQPCDLDSNTNVTLKIVSNLFGDVSKIASNSTYTINLPRTEKNQKIFGLAEYPISRNIGGGQCRCDYYRGGCKMIDNGAAVLTGANEKSYTISVTYGVGRMLQQISDNSTTIQALDDALKVKMQDEYHPNNQLGHIGLTSYSQKDSKDYLLADYNPYTYTKPALAGAFWNDYYGSYKQLDGIDVGLRSWDNAGDHILPCVSLYKILQKYSSQGVNVDFADNNRKNILKDIAIPLVTKNSKADITGISYEHTLANQVTKAGQEIEGAYTVVDWGIGGNQQDTLFTRVQEGYAGHYYLKANNNINLDISLRGKVYLTFENNQSLYFTLSTIEATRVILKVGDNSYKCQCKRLSYNASSGWNKHILNATFEFFAEGKIRIEQNDEVRLIIQCYDTGIYRTIGITEGSVTFANITYEGEVPSGLQLPIYYNLPPITMMELLKAAAFYTGTYPLNINGGNTITLANISDIFTRKNTANSVDWSKKLVSVNEMSAPDNTSFTLSNLAKKNWYKMKDNELARDGYNGCMVVWNETLQNERYAYTLPFITGDARRYPIYEKKIETSGGTQTTTYTFKEGKPAIFGIVENDYTSEGVQTKYCGLAFNELVKPSSVLTKYYEEMERALQNIRLLTANVNLTDIDIANFDETKPVYLAQYGHYYAVLEISTTYGKYASVKLLQI